MVYTATPFLGLVLGPLMGDFINFFTSWRWPFYFVIICTGFNLPPRPRNLPTCPPSPPPLFPILHLHQPGPKEREKIHQKYPSNVPPPAPPTLHSRPHAPKPLHIQRAPPQSPLPVLQGLLSN